MNFRNPSIKVSGHAYTPVQVHLRNAGENGRDVRAILVKSLLFKDPDSLKRRQRNALCPWMRHGFICVGNGGNQCKWVNTVLL